jgi:class 3 adenylate cyclase
MSLPTGIVSLVFCDVEASSALLRARRSDRYGDGLGDVRRLLRRVLVQAGGREVDAHGDEVFTVFESAPEAIAAAVEAQRVVQAGAWPDGANVAVRMGIHTGEPVAVAYGYTGEVVHHAARLCAAAQSGQILVSEATAAALGGALPAGVELHDGS